MTGSAGVPHCDDDDVLVWEICDTRPLKTNWKNRFAGQRILKSWDLCLLSQYTQAMCGSK